MIGPLYRYVSLFIHLPDHGQLCFSQLGAIMNRAALNTVKSLCRPMFSLFEGKYLEVELPSPKGNFVRNG